MSVVARRTLLRSYIAVSLVSGGGVLLLYPYNSANFFFKNKNRHKCKSEYTVACVRKSLACTSQPTQDSVKNVLVYFEIVPVSTITNKTRYAHASRRLKSVVTGLPGRSPIMNASYR